MSFRQQVSASKLTYPDLGYSILGYNVGYS